jgi:hypothetical protein
MLIKPNKNKPIFKEFPRIWKRVEDMLCTTCKAEIKEENFTDEKSKVEYSISGMCQRCQNRAFQE